MSALDDILKYGNTTPNINEWIAWSQQARAELTALRESVAALIAQNAERARRIDEARHVISESSDALDGAGLGGCYASQACRSWLAATAPSPQDAQP